MTWVEADAGQALIAVIDLGSQLNWSAQVTWKREQYMFLPAKEVNRCNWEHTIMFLLHKKAQIF